MAVLACPCANFCSHAVGCSSWQTYFCFDIEMSYFPISDGWVVQTVCVKDGLSITILRFIFHIEKVTNDGETFWEDEQENEWSL